MSVSAMQEQLKEERRKAKEFVRHEFSEPFERHDQVGEMLRHGPASLERVYGGAESAEPRELQLVQAWRPSWSGEWQLARGVVHRVHHEDRTVTVQFLDDQHRCRLPWMSVQPQLDITPVYPTVRLAPGERLPTRAEILREQHEANVRRKREGIPPDAPLPGTEGMEALRPGEHLGTDHVPAIAGDHWGLPAPTLDALRNRSIPPAQVTGEYGRHFYTELYRNRFYPQQQRCVSADGTLHSALPRPGPGPAGGEARIAGHRYIPLEGPEMEQCLDTGTWHPVVEEQQRKPENDGAWFLDPWFLG